MKRRKAESILGSDPADPGRIRRVPPADDVDELLAFLEEMESLFGPIEKPARASTATRFLL